MFYLTTGNLIDEKKSVEKFGQVSGSQTYKMITPATLSKFFDRKNVAIVNTLENPYFVVKKPFKDEYLDLYHHNNNHLVIQLTFEKIL